MEENNLIKITIFAEWNKENFNKVPLANGFMFTVPGFTPENFLQDRTGKPNLRGAQLITKLLVESLSGHIHSMHKNEKWDKKKHLNEVIMHLRELQLMDCNVDFDKEVVQEWMNKVKKQ